jgi:hypothetical protein
MIESIRPGLLRAPAPRVQNEPVLGQVVRNRVPISLGKGYNAAGSSFVTAALARCALAIILLGVMASGAASQRLSGTVRTEGSDAPIGGAQVTVRPAAAGQRAMVATTDTLGFFSVRLPEGGGYRLEVTAAGFEAFLSEEIDVGPAETVTLEIRLGRDVIPLEPIRVAARTTDSRLAGFHERRLSGAFGRFLTRQDVERSSPPRTTELLRGVGGVSLTPVRRGRAAQTGNLVTVRGGFGLCEPALYIDGLRVRQSAESTLDDVLSPQDIEGVEVYSTGSTAPVQFYDPSACGVILFWTRPGGSTDGERFSWRRLAVGLGALAVLGAVLFAQ